MAKQWSKELRALSREYFETDGASVSVKSLNHDFGVLQIDAEKKRYHIHLLEAGANKTPKVDFNSVDELIDNGWAVD